LRQFLTRRSGTIHETANLGCALSMEPRRINNANTRETCCDFGGSSAQTGISRFSVNRPELAAICARILSLQSADWIAGSVSGSLSLPWKIAFPDERRWL
jgi:hypothetical protein